MVQGNLLKGIEKKIFRKEHIEPIKKVFALDYLINAHCAFIYFQEKSCTVRVLDSPEYLCSLLSNKLFIRKQNGSELHFFNRSFSPKIIFYVNGNHIWPKLFVKSSFCDKLE